MFLHTDLAFIWKYIGPDLVQVQIMGGKYEVNINDFCVGELKNLLVLLYLRPFN